MRSAPPRRPSRRRWRVCRAARRTPPPPDPGRDRRPARCGRGGSALCWRASVMIVIITSGASSDRNSAVRSRRRRRRSLRNAASMLSPGARSLSAAPARTRKSTDADTRAVTRAVEQHDERPAATPLPDPGRAGRGRSSRASPRSYTGPARRRSSTPAPSTAATTVRPVPRAPRRRRGRAAAPARGSRVSPATSSPVATVAKHHGAGQRQQGDGRGSERDAEREAGPEQQEHELDRRPTTKRARELAEQQRR